MAEAEAGGGDKGEPSTERNKRWSRDEDLGEQESDRRREIPIEFPLASPS